MNLALLLARAAASFGDRPAVSEGVDVRLDYARFARAAAGFAAGLAHDYGLRPGDRVALAMSNSWEFMPCLLGCWWGGFAAVPVNAKLHPREIAWILGNAGARVCVVTPDLADGLIDLPATIATLDRVLVTETPEIAALFCHAGAAAPAAVASGDLAWLFYTSGTTGRPKGAMLSHATLLNMVMNYFGDVDAVSPGDCILHCAPMSHGSGLYGLPHVAKAANQVVPASGGFDPGEWIDLVGRWPGASCFFAPTMVNRLVAHEGIGRVRIDHVKTIVYGGGPMYVADMKAALARLGPCFAQIYGQGEAPMTITGLPKWLHVDDGRTGFDARLGSVGLARTDVEVRIVGPDDRPLPPGEAGEVAVRGPIVMSGYWRNEAATADALRGGWLHTGDVGRFDDQGYLTLLDRSKDLIISGGSNIYPREVEEVLLTHPDVAEVSVIGRPHADWGEEVVAVVVPRTGARLDPRSLDALCLERIARFKRPKDYLVVDALPKNNYGKVLKTELRRQLNGAD